MSATVAFNFVVEALAARDALVEVRRGAPGEPSFALAVLPPSLAGGLSLPEEGTLYEGTDAREGMIPTGLGGHLLERLVALERAERPVAWVRVERDPPRPNGVRSQAERFVVRNGLSEVMDVALGHGTYVRAHLAWVAEADDRHEGVVSLTLHADDGAVPDERFASLLDVTEPSECLVAAPRERAPGALARVGTWLVPRSEAAVREAVAPLMEGVARRHARDYERIVEYFATLVTETLAPRRKVDPSTLKARVAHLHAERDAKLAALGPRFALRVSLAPAATVVASAPVVRARLKLQRRKESRELVLHAPAGSDGLDAPACDGCRGAAPRPALCDDRLHLLCEGCAPTVQGRLSCPACAAERA